MYSFPLYNGHVRVRNFNRIEFLVDTLCDLITGQVFARSLFNNKFRIP